MDTQQIPGSRHSNMLIHWISRYNIRSIPSPSVSLLTPAKALQYPRLAELIPFFVHENVDTLINVMHQKHLGHVNMSYRRFRKHWYGTCWLSIDHLKVYFTTREVLWKKQATVIMKEILAAIFVQIVAQQAVSVIKHPMVDYIELSVGKEKAFHLQKRPLNQFQKQHKMTRSQGQRQRTNNSSRFTNRPRTRRNQEVEENVVEDDQDEGEEGEDEQDEPGQEQMQ